MERPPDSLKSFADRIAHAAGSEEADQMVRMLRLAGLTGEIANFRALQPLDDDVPAAVYVCEPGVPTRQSRHIGIWERKNENGKDCFVRLVSQMEHWHFWANVGRIEAKGSKLRVVFVGESVARGYLYDPGFTPAMALQMILEEQFGKDQVEVIDLARTNLAYEVRELAIAALQLEPDIAVVFAGNNWDKKTSLPSFADIAEMEQAISANGMVGVKQVCDRFIGRTARTIVRDIAAEYKRSGVPLVWIIPEFNLGDWREPFTNAPYLPDNKNREWILALKEARQALQEGDLTRARQLGERAIELDQGTCAAGYYVLADCCHRSNDNDGERKYLELARDAQSWDNSIMYIPKPYAICQQTLREELPKYDCQIVDLPALFKQHLNGGVPGVRLFIDYCHMSTEGIQIAMGSAASAVLRVLKGIEQPWYKLVGEHVAPAPEIEAEASFLAAIHDAHRYQSYNMVKYFCARAVKHSRHVAELMLNFLKVQVQNKAPLRMSEAELQILNVGSPLVHRYVFPNNDKRLDERLLTAIVEALEDAGIPARDRLDQLYREEHSTRIAESNLLHPYYHLSANQPHEYEALIWPTARVDYDPRYYRAYWPDSRFVFVGEEGLPVHLALTCRLPKFSQPEEKIAIACNGQSLVEMNIGRQWTSWDITVPGDVVRNGVNEIDVHWPIPHEFHTEAALREAIDKLCQMKYPEFYPIFGEIHAFTASSVAVAAEKPHQLEEVAVSQAVA